MSSATNARFVCVFMLVSSGLGLNFRGILAHVYIHVFGIFVKVHVPHHVHHTKCVECSGPLKQIVSDSQRHLQAAFPYKL